MAVGGMDSLMNSISRCLTLVHSPATLRAINAIEFSNLVYKPGGSLTPHLQHLRGFQPKGVAFSTTTNAGSTSASQILEGWPRRACVFCATSSSCKRTINCRPLCRGLDFTCYSISKSAYEQLEYLKLEKQSKINYLCCLQRGLAGHK